VFRGLFTLLVASLIITVLVSTGLWRPGPFFNDLIDRLTRLSEPPPEWSQRIEGRPDVVAIMNRVVVVASRGFVEGRHTSDGERDWTVPVHWAYPAGDVVVAQPRPQDPDADPSPDRGFAVLEPVRGKVRWSDAEASAVWIYSNDIVALTCPDDQDCRLRDWSHDGMIRWEMSLPSAARSIRGPNPHLATVRDPAGWFAAASSGNPSAIPPVMPLLFDDQIYVVDTVEHRVLRQAAAPDRQTRVTFLGDRMLHVRADRADAGCTFVVEAFDVDSGAVVWTEHGFDLDTARGAGCEQREDPIGAGSKLVVNGSDARPMLVGADEAERIWTGPPGARVLATDGLLAVVVGPDRKSVSIIDAVTPDGRTVWSGELGLDPTAAITSSMVILRDTDGGRLIVVGRTSKTVVLELKTRADVAGYGPTGIVLTSGRSIGYYPVRLT
jgi:outer membrane protein assembly factor BamB